MRSLYQICWLVPAFWVAAAGCSAPERSFDNAGGSSAGGSGGQGGTGGSGACPSTHACVVTPADGWSVPVAVAAGTPAPSCPSAYPDVVLDAKNDLSFDPAVCDCACGAASVDCGPLRLLWSLNCSQPLAVDDLTILPDTCTMVVAKGPTVRALFIESPPGPCPVQPAVTVEPPRFDTSLRACGGATELGGCEGAQVCVPKVIPPFSSVCVYREGDHPCPPGYLVKATHYASVNDTRGCSPCTCGNPSAASCSTTVHTFSDAVCMTSKALTFMTDGNCVSQFNGYFTYDLPAITGGTCAPGAVMPEGSVELADLYTICCAE